VDGLINFEEPLSSLEELSFNPVSYSVKTIKMKSHEAEGLKVIK